MIAAAVVAPLTASEVNVPTLVKLLAVTLDAKVAPLNVPAGAITTAVVRVDIRPYASGVITGIVVDEPTDAAPGPVDAKLIPVPLMVKLPPPELVLTTLTPLS